MWVQVQVLQFEVTATVCANVRQCAIVFARVLWVSLWSIKPEFETKAITSRDTIKRVVNINTVFASAFSECRRIEKGTGFNSARCDCNCHAEYLPFIRTLRLLRRFMYSDVSQEKLREKNTNWVQAVLLVVSVLNIAANVWACSVSVCTVKRYDICSVSYEIWRVNPLFL
jgi:hypothetical protein